MVSVEETQLFDVNEFTIDLGEVMTPAYLNQVD